MATAPRDTPIKVGEEDTAIGVEDDYAAGKRRRTRRRTLKKRGGANWTFKGFVPQTVNTAAPPPPNAPAGPLGGRRRRKTRKHRGGGGEYKVPQLPVLPPGMKAGRRRSRKH